MCNHSIQTYYRDRKVDPTMKRSIAQVLFAAATIFAAFPGLASAHVGVGETSGFAAGFFHPLLGMDHVLAMLAVGLWAAQAGGRMTWAAPCTFVAVMIAGGALGAAGAPLPFVEQGILASVLVLGLLISAAARLPFAYSIAVVAFFALFHGHAHGTEMPLHASGAAYSAGFALATVLLHAAGIGVGAGLAKLDLVRLVRYAGGAITLLGVGLALAG